MGESRFFKNWSRTSLHSRFSVLILWTRKLLFSKRKLHCDIWIEEEIPGFKCHIALITHDRVTMYEREVLYCLISLSTSCRSPESFARSYDSRISRLNDCLETGPSLLPELVSVLLKEFEIPSSCTGRQIRPLPWRPLLRTDPAFALGDLQVAKWAINSEDVMKEIPYISLACVSSETHNLQRFFRPEGGGGGVVPYIGYKGMCGNRGYVFCFNRFSLK